jgi:hypothetical protein
MIYRYLFDSIFFNGSAVKETTNKARKTHDSLPFYTRDYSCAVQPDPYCLSRIQTKQYLMIYRYLFYSIFFQWLQKCPCRIRNRWIRTVINSLQHRDPYVTQDTGSGDLDPKEIFTDTQHRRHMLIRLHSYMYSMTPKFF